MGMRAALVLGALLAPVLLTPGLARADTQTLQGDGLTFTLTGSSDAVLETDPALKHAVRIVAESTDCLVRSGSRGGSVELDTAPCSDSGTVTVMIPPDFPVKLTIAGSGNVRAGELMGPLSATLTSDGDLAIHHAGIVQIMVNGSGDVTLGDVDGASDIQVEGSGTVKMAQVRGPLKLSQHGSGDVTIGQAHSVAVDIDNAGSGDAAIGGGDITYLRVRTNGSGDISVGGTVGTADLQASGGADIRLAKATGTVQRHASGGSSIHVGDGVAAVAGKVVRAFSSDDDGDSNTSVTISHETGGFGHLIAGLLVLGVLIVAWRTIARNGGLKAWRGRAAAGTAPAAPSHPGVVAVCDLIAQLERRLARVETHVTSREFELNQKFREMDAGERK